MGVQLGVAVTTTVSVHAIETPSKRTRSPINTFMSKNPLSSSVPYHVPRMAPFGRMAPFERIEVRLRTLLGGLLDSRHLEVPLSIYPFLHPYCCLEA